MCTLQTVEAVAHKTGETVTHIPFECHSNGGNHRPLTGITKRAHSIQPLQPHSLLPNTWTYFVSGMPMDILWLGHRLRQFSLIPLLVYPLFIHCVDMEPAPTNTNKTKKNKKCKKRSLIKLIPFNLLFVLFVLCSNW